MADANPPRAGVKSGRPVPPPAYDPSMKARKAVLFDEDVVLPDPAAPAVVRKPFRQHLRETPPEPLSAGLKAALWAAGVVVALLFLASLWAMARPGASRATPAKSAQAKVAGG
jgi:hypothetical protein